MAQNSRSLSLISGKSSQEFKQLAKSREKTNTALLACQLIMLSSLSSSAGVQVQLMNWSHPHSGWVFLHQLTTKTFPPQTAPQDNSMKATESVSPSESKSGQLMFHLTKASWMHWDPCTFFIFFHNEPCLILPCLHSFPFSSKNRIFYFFDHTEAGRSWLEHLGVSCFSWKVCIENLASSLSLISISHCVFLAWVYF